jgi:hypothetical protein
MVEDSGARLDKFKIGPGLLEAGEESSAVPAPFSSSH